MCKILIIDNYDSFTWNLYQYFSEIGGIVEVRRNDVIRIADIECLSPEYLVISPGPGTPDEAGISLGAVSYFQNKIPILGVCLGHQVIAQFFGAKLSYSDRVMHGKSSVIRHNGRGVFSGLIYNINVIRYNSLIVDPSSIPDCLEVTAWSVENDKNDEIMGIRHREVPIEGVQFHPESVLTEQGHHMLRNFLNY